MLQRHLTLIRVEKDFETGAPLAQLLHEIITQIINRQQAENFSWRARRNETVEMQRSLASRNRRLGRDSSRRWSIIEFEPQQEERQTSGRLICITFLGVVSAEYRRQADLS